MKTDVTQTLTFVSGSPDPHHLMIGTNGNFKSPIWRSNIINTSYQFHVRIGGSGLYGSNYGND